MATHVVSSESLPNDEARAVEHGVQTAVRPVEDRAALARRANQDWAAEDCRAWHSINGSHRVAQRILIILSRTPPTGKETAEIGKK